MPKKIYVCEPNDHDLQIIDQEKLKVDPESLGNGKYKDHEIRVVAFCKRCGYMMQSELVITTRLILPTK